MSVTEPVGIRIRNESPSDVAAIHDLIEVVFRNAAHTSHTEPFIVAALRAADQLVISLVAECQGVLLAHAAVSPVNISDGSTHWYGLGPVSVIPAQQQKGIGTRIVAQALDELRRRGAAGCVVLGDPAYYGRFGFKALPSLALPGVPPEYFQALSFAGPMPAGDVTYHESFSAPGC